MASRFKSRIWPLCRFCFRQFRIAMWLLLLVLVAVLIYLNQVGLPDVLKQPVLAALRERGLGLQFSRLRLRWYRGIVADNVRFERANEPFTPQLTAREMQVRLNHNALRNFQVQVDSVVLREGQFIWPVVETNASPRRLLLDHLSTELRLLPNDQWALDHFNAVFSSAHIQLSGTITNASAIRDWSFFASNEPTPVGLWQSRVRKFADYLEQIRFSATPELRLSVHGDARQLQSFNVHLLLSAPGAETPWGSVREGQFIARILPVTNGGISRASLTLRAVDAQTQWGSTTNLHLDVNLAPPSGSTNMLDADLALSADRVVSKWANSSDLKFSAQWAHSLTNPVPLEGQAQLSFGQTETRWASVRAAALNASMAISPTNPAPAPSLDWWTNLQPYSLVWDCRVTNMSVQGVEFSEALFTGTWVSPRLALNNLQARLADGALNIQGDVNISNRVAQLRMNSDVDPHRLTPWLGETARKWLADCSWPSSPRLEAQAAVALPSWTNREPDWMKELQPSLTLDGGIILEQGFGFRQVEVSSLRTHVTYSNRVFGLSDLVVARPEGWIRASHRTDSSAHSFYWKISSTIDPNALRPLVGPEALDTFNLFSLSTPPTLDAEIWGKTEGPVDLGARGRVALTNFAFRNQTATSFETQFEYTNNLVRLTWPRLRRGEERLNAESLLLDLKTQLIHLTNGFSTADPEAVTKAIGPHIWQVVQPYRFHKPPTVHAHGIIPIHNDEEADIVFEVDGGPFSWLNFNVPHISGNVHWRGDQLDLREVKTDFYGGNAFGSADLNFTTNHGTELKFEFHTTNTLIKPLVMDLTGHTNRMEGRLSGSLFIIQGNSEENRSVFGYGDLRLRDGLIWEIPLFGIFSPVLDSIIPGLGSSRASAGNCSFVITNGVIRSDDLEIKTRGARLAYRGTVDFKQQLNARVDAELMRDVWLVGPVVSTALWPVTKMFEFKVTGSLEEPKTKTVYIVPKILVLPFLPFRALKGLMPQEPNPVARTNAPAVTPTTKE